MTTTQQKPTANYRAWADVEMYALSTESNRDLTIAARKVRDAERIVIVAPKPTWGTPPYRRAIEKLHALYPNGRVFTPDRYLTPTSAWETPLIEITAPAPELGHGWELISHIPDPAQPKRLVQYPNLHGRIAWGNILDTADAVYVLQNPDGRVRLADGYGYIDGTIGHGCIANIHQAKRHGATILVITRLHPFHLFRLSDDWTIVRDDRGTFISDGYSNN